MKHASALAGITNPTVNSYKRLNAPRTTSGATWAPNTVTWTGNNRTHMVRVPGPGRFEVRLPDGAANPYLMQAVILAAGLDGLRSQADPGPRHDLAMHKDGHTELVEDAPDMELRGMDRDPEPPRDDLVGCPLGEQRQDLPLPRGQSGAGLGRRSGTVVGDDGICRLALGGESQARHGSQELGQPVGQRRLGDAQAQDDRLRVPHVAGRSPMVSVATRASPPRRRPSLTACPMLSGPSRARRPRRDARGAALVVVATPGASILGNVFSGRMPTNAIRLEDGAEGAAVAGNLVLGGDRAGIVVRNAGSGVTVSGNIVWRRDGSGIVIAGSECGRVEGNLVIENAQKGIEMCNSPDGFVIGNRILGNENAAIWVSDQEPGALTILDDNEIAFNGAGLAGAGGEGILLDGNDFSSQFLQFLSGDLTPQSPHLARDMTGQRPMVLSTAGRSDPPPGRPACFG